MIDINYLNILYFRFQRKDHARFTQSCFLYKIVLIFSIDLVILKKLQKICA